MKILQILPSLEVGGVERGVIDLARAFKARGEESIVISSGGRLVTELQKMGVRHFTLPVHKKSLLSLRVVPKIMDILRKERVDIVHARSRVPGWLAWIACRLTGTPFVTTCHGYYSNHLLSRVMGWGKYVIVISKIIGRHMIDDFGVAPEKIRLIHRGLDLSEFEFLPFRERPEPKTFQIINIGRLSPIKGQLEFLKAVHLLRSRVPKIKVLLVGSESKKTNKYTGILKSAIHQLGLESCVELLGTRKDIPELIAKSDLSVLSTIVPEAFGRVLIESGAVGTPVLATRVGGVLDIIEDGVDGRLVSPGDAPAMADAMQELLTDRPRAAQYADRLRKKIENNFSLDPMTDKTLAVYREVLLKKKILVIKLGAMGDLILCVPSFRMLRHRFPESNISLLVDKKLAPLITTCPYLNEVIPVDRSKLSALFYLLKIAKKIRRESFETSVDLQNSKWTHLLAVLGGIPERYGFRRGKLGFLVNRHDRSFEISEAPVRNQFRILSKLGIQKLEDELELWPVPDSEERIEQIMGSPQIDGRKLVGLAIGASPKWQTKRWPLENYKELVGRLMASGGFRIVLIGSAQEERDANALSNGTASQFVNFVGKTNLPDLVSVIKRLDVLVTGDTAPLHIAAAVKTKFVAIFGPTDARRHAPPTEEGLVLTRHLPCQPCYEGNCREEENLACLRRISVDEVFQNVVKQITHENSNCP